MGNERMFAKESLGAVLGKGGGLEEKSGVLGVYHAICRDKDGNIKWDDVFENTVVTVGKNLALDTILAGSSYTVVGPYMGLINGTDTISATDTMSSHSGWQECGNANAPTYSGTRQTAVFSSASAGSKALSSALVFTFTGSGTVAGAFLVYGASASASIDNTSGTLLSAGLFSGGSKTVASSDTISVSWSLSM